MTSHGRDTAYARHVPGFGHVTVTPVDPDADLDLLHAWVTGERARFWGMADATRDDVREVYRSLDAYTTHHAFLVRRDGTPAALLQTYEPEADRVGETYEPQPGDLGLHLLVAPAAGAPQRGFTAGLLRGVFGFLFADASRHRLVADPDAANEPAIARLTRAGFTLGPDVVLPEVDLPEVYLPAKRAQLAFLTREAAGLG
ncbi:GNAT family N-acetyltransferase [Streptomyces sp. NPDC051940]|uniref:GNAT family N-acetyltransferase n=1 Tax=Streptomyces sp. NPDC051940 TaxID=3155675 RepID=UPI003431ED1F